MFRLEEATTLLVVKSKPLLSKQMKLTDTSNLNPFKSLLMFTILLEPIWMIICFFW